MKTCIIPLALMFVATACHNITTVSPDTPDINASKLELLAGKVSKTWLLTANKINGVDFMPAMPACAKDDILILRVENSFEWNEGPGKCKPSNPQIILKGGWELSKSETEVIFDAKDTYKIEDLSAAKLRISHRNIFGDVEERIFTVQK